jgi:pilus assembly protein Flp/PilA
MLNELFARITTWATIAREEAGQGLVEYALILVLVSIVAIVTLSVLGVDVQSIFGDVNTELEARP